MPLALTYSSAWSPPRAAVRARSTVSPGTRLYLRSLSLITRRKLLYVLPRYCHQDQKNISSQSHEDSERILNHMVVRTACRVSPCPLAKHAINLWMFSSFLPSLPYYNGISDLCMWSGISRSKYPNTATCNSDLQSFTDIHRAKTEVVNLSLDSLHQPNPIAGPDDESDDKL